MQLRAILAGLLGVFAALVAASPAWAGGALVGQPLTACVAPAQPGITAAKVFAARTGFDCKMPQTAFGAGDFWVVSGPISAAGLGDMPLGVRTASLWQRGMTLYALYPNGEIVSRPADDVKTARRIQLGAIVMQRLPYRQQPPVRLAWHVEGSANLRGILVAPRIATPSEGATANLTMAALYAAFAGLAAALLIHNLAMWRVLKQRFQLWYLAMLAGILLYAFSSSGALAWVWPDLPNTFRMRVNYFTLAASAFAALGFARSFFEPRVFAGWLGKFASATGAALLLTAALYAIAAPWRIGLLDTLYVGSFLALLTVAATMMWRAWRLNSDFLWLFALAWGAPITVAAVRVAHNLHLVGWNFWLDNSTLATMAAEALGSSLAIAYRVRQLARERDTARAEELAARLLADADPLTGLLNRRAFLAQAVGRSGDQALLILDLDRFKTVNDTIGHDGGDEVLRLVARVLASACPPGGLVTRFGGEEFALLTPAGQAPSADRLLALLRETRMPYDLKITASIGGCQGPLANERDRKRLYRAADQALFAAKHGGRDRARLSPAPAALAA